MVILQVFSLECYMGTLVNQGKIACLFHHTNKLFDSNSSQEKKKYFLDICFTTTTQANLLPIGLRFAFGKICLYHSLLGSQIKTVDKSCNQSEIQRTNQTDKEPIMSKMNSARIKYILLAWVLGHLVGKGGIKEGRRNL